MKKPKESILNYSEPITKIYFIRHGETLANRGGLIFGHLDVELTKKGIIQANNAAIKLLKLLKKKNEKIDHIFSSPLKRAKDTAKIVSKKLNIKNIVIEKNLIEKSEGVWEGKTYHEVEKSDPLDFSKWFSDLSSFRPKNGESMLDLHKRVIKVKNKFLKEHQNKTIVVVSHAGPIQLFLLHSLDAKIEKLWSIKTECGSISEITLSKSQSIVYRINH
jgi:broad specificity phosphatase PhoE